MMTAQYTRTGARRSGDDYQDIVALDMLVEMLEHPDRYKWTRVEADDFGSLDDVVALRADGKFVAKQVKFSVHPGDEGDEWTWEHLTRREKGEKGEKPSLVEKWASSLETLLRAGPVAEVCLVTNRKPGADVETALTPDNFIDFDKISDQDTRNKIVKQLGGKEKAGRFFSKFRFRMDHPGLEVLEEAVKQRFHSLGGEPKGWLNLKDELRSWVGRRTEPPPIGEIRMAAVRKAALWCRLQSMPQGFKIPTDFVLPEKEFHLALARNLPKLKKGCIVITGSPGVGKSTYISYLYRTLEEKKMPVVRHHYFLSLSDRTPGRLDHELVIQSLMGDIQRRFPEAVADLGPLNPNPSQFTLWVEACGKYFSRLKKALIIIVDGMDHVWRERKSIEELDRVLEHLVPLPDGIVLLLGMQPLSADQLPPRLLRIAPRDKWRNLPPLKREAVKRWLKHHENEMRFQKDQQLPEALLQELAAAFFKKSEGHPLILRYTLTALLERNLPVTEKNVDQLPGCAHRDIARYYEELWSSLAEGGREILRLFAACPFAWRERGVIECLDPQGSRSPQITRDLRQVKHLLARDALGWGPFHNSVLGFMKEQMDYQEHSRTMKEWGLNWLRTSAPDYWKWAYTWLLESDLGNNEPLIRGPDRQWAVEAIAKCRPHEEASEILARSAWSALQQGNLPRFVQVGLLRDYFDTAYEFRSETIGELLDPQLSIEEDECLLARLYADLRGLSDTELVSIAERGAFLRDQTIVQQCFDELNDRLRSGSTRITYSSWVRQVTPLLRAAALDHTLDPGATVEFAQNYRKRGESSDMLEIYMEMLQSSRAVAPMRQVMGKKLSLDERSAVLRHTVMLALEEGFDLEEQIFAKEDSEDAYVAIYAALRKAESPKLSAIRFPGTGLLDLEERDQYRHHDDIKKLFTRVFFCLLANYLCDKGNLNKEWLTEAGAKSWPYAFLGKLDDVASKLARSLLCGDSVSYRWFYEQIGTLRKPTWPRDREVVDYGNCARKAAHQIGLDILLLSNANGGKPEITREDLESIFPSAYFYSWDWLDAYLKQRRKWINAQAAEWLMRNLVADLVETVEEFPERASKFSALASLAASHGFPDEAKSFARKAAQNLITYGEHKDLLLASALETAELCCKAGVSDASRWLLRLAPAIAKVRDFTDGDETRHLPRELGRLISAFIPELLPTYYQWLCREEQHYDAMSAFGEFVKTADLSAGINQAVARTTVDDESLAILFRRKEEGDPGAEEAIGSVIALLGEGTQARIESREPENETVYSPLPKKQPMPPPADFPPERFADYLDASTPEAFYTRGELAENWLKHWRDTNKKEEAFGAVEKMVKGGTELDKYDIVFDLAMSLYGKANAYRWIVKAQIAGYGWDRYFTHKKDTVERWKLVRKHYSDSWLRFVQDSMVHKTVDPWRGISVSNKLVRLVEYCLLMEKRELAKQISETAVSFVLELVSPVTLPTPEWTKEV